MVTRTFEGIVEFRGFFASEPFINYIKLWIYTYFSALGNARRCVTQVVFMACVSSLTIANVPSGMSDGTVQCNANATATAIVKAKQNLHTVRIVEIIHR